ncbi:hypothetical protein H0H87_005144 [Tephrocybe sp. NHM501043]|nr:hypothetical protein H0H87_005144 [Tephrocybe sp. NHM501043]
MANILIDDTGGAGGLVSTFGDWITISSDVSMGGSMQYAGSIGGSIQIEFTGTSIAFFGPFNTSGEAFELGSVSIDGQISTGAVSIQKTVPTQMATGTTNSFQSGHHWSPVTAMTVTGVVFAQESTTNARWYQSDRLSDGAHTIAFDNVKFVFFDYAIVTAGENQQLTGSNVIVDDEDSSWTHEGDWTPYEGQTMIVNKTIVFSPFSNTTLKTRTVESSVTVKFSGVVFGLLFVTPPLNKTCLGTAVSVYGQSVPPLQSGIPPLENRAKPSLGTMGVRYTLDNFTTDQTYIPPDAPAMNLLLFSNSSIDVGEHTLKIELTEAADSDLSFDYIIYTASEASSPSVVPHSAPVRDILIGSIAGGVIVIILLLALVVYRMRGRKKKVLSQESTGIGTIEVKPFMLPNLESAASPPGLFAPQRKPPLPRLEGIHTAHQETFCPAFAAEPESATVLRQLNRPTNPTTAYNAREEATSAQNGSLIVDKHHHMSAAISLPQSAQPASGSSGFPDRQAIVARTKLTLMMPPPPYEQSSFLKGEDGEIVNDRLKEFLNHLQ